MRSMAGEGAGRSPDMLRGEPAPRFNPSGSSSNSHSGQSMVKSDGFHGIFG
jgi:hypothetical protein